MEKFVDIFTHFLFVQFFILEFWVFLVKIEKLLLNLISFFKIKQNIVIFALKQIDDLFQNSQRHEIHFLIHLFHNFYLILRKLLRICLLVFVSKRIQKFKDHLIFIVKFQAKIENYFFGFHFHLHIIIEKCNLFKIWFFLFEIINDFWFFNRVLWVFHFFK